MQVQERGQLRNLLDLRELPCMLTQLLDQRVWELLLVRAGVRDQSLNLRSNPIFAGRGWHMLPIRIRLQGWLLLPRRGQVFCKMPKVQ
uniref:Uncharacterized protein n=1 Tax=Spironucleus salmonicida TaxID=348837 RepID=V6LQ07_9EUKA|eukprot:EST46752.1 Hypothetical protein SS50377_13210 [Spironucleus salmonicida]